MTTNNASGSDTLPPSLRASLHELGNHLSIVIGHAEYLLHEPDPPDRQEALEAIRSAALDARETILGIRRTMRPGAGTVEPARRTPAPAAAGPRATSRVLVIDDEEEVREILATLIRQLGHEAETAASGEDGIRRYAAQRFDCVVTDLTMPGFDGLKVARAIKAFDPTAYVVLLSGADAPSDDAALARAGVDRVVAKPLTRGDIVRLVQRPDRAGDRR